MNNPSMQQTINRMSLVMTIPEDIVKACKENDFSNAMTETLLRLHDQQTQIEKALNELRTTTIQIAQVIDMQANAVTNIHAGLASMSQRLGYDDDEMISTEALKEN